MNKYSLQTGLKINTKKTESLRINAQNQQPFKIAGENVKDVETFTYLGATVTTNGGTEKEMKLRIGKARSAYYRLNKVWRSTLYRRKTKLRIFQSNVLSILTYGCETWKMTETDEHRLDVFFHKSLRKIFQIYWPRIAKLDRWQKWKS